MRKRILFITCEMLPFPGKPVCGGGIRVFGLGNGLASAGHEVVYSLPAELVDDDETLPESIRRNSHVPERLGDRIIEVMPDLIIVEQWGLLTYIDDLKIPLAADLHGPLSLENAFKTGSNFRTDSLTKIDALSKADFLICPGRFQKHYFYTWFLMAGADPLDAEIVVAPVGMPNDLPQRKPTTHPHLVFGGVTWPWIDPFPGLALAADAIAKREDAAFDLFVQHPPLIKDHPLYAINRNITRSYDEKLTGKRGVALRDFIPHDELIDLYTGATGAYDLYRANHERELAVTTRTLEYLWAGLPVIYSDYAELADPIREYDAGWIVDPEDETAIEAALAEMLDNRELAEQKGKNAQKLIADRYTWKQSVKELLPFVDNPRRRSKNPTLMAGFRDYFRKESVEEILEGKNQVAALNDEIRHAMYEVQEREKRMEALREQIRELQSEKDKQLRAAAEEHKKDLDKKDAEVSRLLEKIDYEIRTRDDEIKRLHTDRQLAEKRAQEELLQLSREKENAGKEAATEIKRIAEKHESALAEIKKARELEAEKHLAEVKKLHEEITAAAKDHSAQLQKAADEKTEMRDRASDDQRKLIEERDRLLAEAKERAQSEKQRLQERIDKLSEELEQTRKEMGGEIKSLNREKETSRQKHEAQIVELVKKHDEERSELKTELADRTDALQKKLDAETERRAALEISLQEEIRRLNREKQELTADHDKALSALREKHDDKLTRQSDEHREIQKKIEDRLETQREQHEKKIDELQTELKTVNRKRSDLDEKHAAELAEQKRKFEKDQERLQDELRRISRLREDEQITVQKAREKQQNDFETRLRESAENAKKEIERRDAQIERFSNRLETIDREWVAKLQEKDDVIRGMKEKMDSLNSEISARITELSRVAADKERYIEEAEKRFDQLEQRLTSETRRANQSADELTAANASLQAQDATIRMLTAEAERLKSDSRKAARQIDDLQTELPTLRKRAQLAERQVEDLRERPGLKNRSRRSVRTGRMIAQLPRLGFLWSVNLVTNAYMEMWQRRTGKRLFPGTEKAKKGERS